MVKIDLDKPRNLKFDIRALKDLEAAMDGKPLMNIIRDVMNGGVTAIVTSMWAALKHEDATLNINLVTKMLQSYMDQGKNLRVLGRALGEAFKETGLLKTEEDEQPEGNEQATVATA